MANIFLDAINGKSSKPVLGKTPPKFAVNPISQDQGTLVSAPVASPIAQATTATPMTVKQGIAGAKEIAKGTGNIFKDALQGTARSFLSTAETIGEAAQGAGYGAAELIKTGSPKKAFAAAANAPTLQIGAVPGESKIEKGIRNAIIGSDEPVKSLTTRVAEAEPTTVQLGKYVEDQLKDEPGGITKAFFQKLGQIIQKNPALASGIAIGATTAADILPGGSEAKILEKELLEATTKQAAEEILLRRGITGDLVGLYAEKFAKAATGDEVQVGLKSLARVIETTSAKAGESAAVKGASAEGENIFKKALAQESSQIPSQTLKTAPETALTPPASSIPKDIEPLAQEARKYKSAEEFVAAQGTPVYHATSVENAKSIEQNGMKLNLGDRSLGVTKGQGAFFYENPSNAKTFESNFKNGTTVEARIKGKIFDATGNEYGSINSLAEDAKLISKLKSEGYVAVRGEESGIPATFVFDETAIKTKSQLQDFYTKATKGASEIASPGTNRTVKAFEASTAHEPIGQVGDSVFELGTFGKNHDARKLLEVKADRFPQEELPATVSNITKSFKASDSPTTYRAGNVAWLSEMPNGEKRIVYTRQNKKGAEEIISWHSVDEAKNPNYLKTLESYGPPERTRTSITALERQRPNPLNDGGKVAPTPEATLAQSSAVDKTLESSAPALEMTKPTGPRKPFTKEASISDTSIKLPDGRVVDMDSLDGLKFRRDRFAKMLEKNPENKALQTALGQFDERLGKVSAGAAVAKPGSAERTVDAFYEGLKNVSDKRSYEEARQKAIADMVKEYGPETYATKKPSKSFFGKIWDKLEPLKHQDKEIQRLFTELDRKLLVGKQLAEREMQRLNTTAVDGIDVIMQYQAGRQTPFKQAIKDAFDALREEGVARGLDIPYIKNYLPQVYANNPHEVMEALAKYMESKGASSEQVAEFLAGKEISQDQIRRMKLNPYFIKEKVFPDYQTAMEYGLTPKYTNVGQLMANYRNEMEKTIANREFLQGLSAKGKILPAEIAPSSWKEINLPASRGQRLFAPPEFAGMINAIYRDEGNLGLVDQVFKAGTWLNHHVQDIALSGGVPMTQINGFSTGQMIKELGAGNVKSVIPYIRSHFNGASARYFIKEAPTIERMAAHGIDLGGKVSTYAKLYDNMVEKGVWKEMFGGNVKKASEVLFKKSGNTFDKLFNEKVFGSFMPQLNIQTFKDAEARFLKSGMAAPEAEALAAEVVKKFYGLTDNVGRGKLTQDVLSTTFFAPRYREGIINFLYNSLKSVGPEFFNPAYYKNRRFVAGTAIAFGMYEALNYSLNGHSMQSNEPGHEFDVRIPLDKFPEAKATLHAHDGDIVYVSFMPGIFTIPRNIASGTIALAHGDIKTAKQKYSSVFSMPLKIAGEIWANRDYFDRPIYKDDDSPSEKIKKIALYAGLQAGHPYIREIGKRLTTAKDKPIYQSASEAMELPFKFSSYDKASASAFYDAMDKQTKERNKLKKKIQPLYDKIQTLKEQGNQDEARRLYDTLSKAEKGIYQSLKITDKRQSTMTLEARMYKTYEQLQEMKASGQTDQARVIYNALSPEEKSAYQKLRARLQ